MSKPVTIIEPGMRGVDMRENPYFLGRNKATYASNLSFDEGDLKTRFPIRYHNLGLKGKLQYALSVNLGRGISRGVFATDTEMFVVIVDGKAYYITNDPAYGSGECEGKRDKTPRFCEPKPICNLSFPCDEIVKIAQIESYIVFYGPTLKTHIWDGEECWESPGMEDRCASIEDERGYEPESFCRENLKNWIPHYICDLEYLHGRAHAEVGGNIIVGDMVHKRGETSDLDALTFEEAAHDSYGIPLGVPSRIAPYTKLAAYPAMNTRYGEGDLIGYTYGGIVRHNTFQTPRQTRYTAAGELTQKGWSHLIMVDHLANTVTATGDNAVTVTPRDHFFASSYGVHFLSNVTGEGSFNDETTRTMSQPVEPLFQIDSENLLGGRATGHWLEGSRYFCTIGQQPNDCYWLPSGKSFVSFNQATSYTQDRTPIPDWEGLMELDDEMVGVHQFISTSVRPSRGSYGFLTSKKSDKSIYFAEMVYNSEETKDSRDGKQTPIPWKIRTRRMTSSGLAKTSSLEDATMRFVVDDPTTELEVWVRTSKSPCWEKWRTVKGCPDQLDKSHRVLSVNSLGKPPEGYRDNAWYEIEVRGTGYAELESLHAWVTEGEIIKSKSFCRSAGERVINYFKELRLQLSSDYGKQCQNCMKPLRKETPCSCGNRSE